MRDRYGCPTFSTYLRLPSRSSRPSWTLLCRQSRNEIDAALDPFCPGRFGPISLWINQYKSAEGFPAHRHRARVRLSQCLFARRGTDANHQRLVAYAAAHVTVHHKAEPSEHFDLGEVAFSRNGSPNSLGRFFFIAHCGFSHERHAKPLPLVLESTRLGIAWIAAWEAIRLLNAIDPRCARSSAPGALESCDGYFGLR